MNQHVVKNITLSCISRKTVFRIKVKVILVFLALIKHWKLLSSWWHVGRIQTNQDSLEESDEDIEKNTYKEVMKMMFSFEKM